MSRDMKPRLDSSYLAQLHAKYSQSPLPVAEDVMRLWWELDNCRFELAGQKGRADHLKAELDDLNSRYWTLTMYKVPGGNMSNESGRDKSDLAQNPSDFVRVPREMVALLIDVALQAPERFSGRGSKTTYILRNTVRAIRKELEAQGIDWRTPHRKLRAKK